MEPTGNDSYPGLPKRDTRFLLYAVGKPVFHKYNENEIFGGSWMKDPVLKTDKDKIYATRENVTNVLYEFLNKAEFRNHPTAKNAINIEERFMGNSHVIYNGSFYYNKENSDVVVKLNLVTRDKKYNQLPYSGYSSGKKLYSTDFNYIDFNVDENGIWIIYTTDNSNNTIVAKLDAENLLIQYSWNITLDHKKYGEMFIVCGILYVLDSTTDKSSQIRIAIDLYQPRIEKVDLPFSNPFRRTSTVGYNPQSVELYSFDKGNQLTYPIRYSENSNDNDDNGNNEFSK